jgi:hypothetical protein
MAQCALQQQHSAPSPAVKPPHAPARLLDCYCDGDEVPCFQSRRCCQEAGCKHMRPLQHCLARQPVDHHLSTSCAAHSRLRGRGGESTRGRAAKRLSILHVRMLTLMPYPVVCSAQGRTPQQQHPLTTGLQQVEGLRATPRHDHGRRHGWVYEGRRAGQQLPQALHDCLQSGRGGKGAHAAHAHVGLRAHGCGNRCADARSPHLWRRAQVVDAQACLQRGPAQRCRQPLQLCRPKGMRQVCGHLRGRWRRGVWGQRGRQVGRDGWRPRACRLTCGSHCTLGA